MIETPGIRLTSLTKRFGALTAVDDVSLTVPTGQILALLGPNGAGKSTLIGILSALVNKTGGRVRVFGHDLDRDLESVKRCLDGGKPLSGDNMKAALNSIRDFDTGGLIGVPISIPGNSIPVGRVYQANMKAQKMVAVSDWIKL